MINTRIMQSVYREKHTSLCVVNLNMFPLLTRLENNAVYPIPRLHFAFWYAAILEASQL